MHDAGEGFREEPVDAICMCSYALQANTTHKSHMDASCWCCCWGLGAAGFGPTQLASSPNPTHLLTVDAEQCQQALRTTIAVLHANRKQNASVTGCWVCQAAQQLRVCWFAYLQLLQE